MWPNPAADTEHLLDEERRLEQRPVEEVSRRIEVAEGDLGGRVAFT
jgi:hypothetical protein